MGLKQNTPLLLCLAVLAGTLGGCAGSGRHRLLGVNGEPVRRVEWKQELDLRPFAEAARQLGNETYPRIAAMLGAEPATVPPHFDVVFGRTRSSQAAETQLSRFRPRPRIVVNTDYFTPNKLSAPRTGTDPSNFEVLMVHEMVHVAQHCQTRWEPKSWEPRYWVEGIADFVQFRLGYTNTTFPAECSSEMPHYNSGYGCAAAFLLFVEARHGTNIVRQLHASLRQGSYTDAFFKQVTGETLDELWARFQGTPAFTPRAAKMNKLRVELGYVDGKPPKDVNARFEAYVKSLPGGTNTAAALHFMQKLADQGRLPGFSRRKRPVFMRGESLQGSFVMPDAADPDAYPVSRKLFCYDRQSFDTYWYIVVRKSPTSAWELTNAWRTDEEERVVEKYR